jgi:hypothetical protein
MQIENTLRLRLLSSGCKHWHSNGFQLMKQLYFIHLSHCSPQFSRFGYEHLGIRGLIGAILVLAALLLSQSPQKIEPEAKVEVQSG